MPDMQCHYWSWIPDSRTPGLLFDIETDGFLETASTIHCLVAKDIQSGEVWSYGPEQIEEGLSQLAQAPLLVGHNALCFDIPIIRKLYPEWSFQGHVFDTLTASRLIWTDLQELDYRRLKGKYGYQLPSSLAGKHKLEAWGYRLGVLKGEYGQKGAAPTDIWAAWTPEMQAYCEQDVAVLEALYRTILGQRYSPQALALEHAFQQVMFEQELEGVPFDLARAHTLYADLSAERDRLAEQLQEAFPPKRIETIFVPKVNNKSKGYVKGEPFIKVHTLEFNPNSRQHITDRLKEKYGYEPTEFTPTGEAKMDEQVLASLPYAECDLLCRYLELSKLIGMLAEGKVAWMRLVDEAGRIHGRVITNGAVTGRCTHNSPNLAQIPRSGPWGKACRALFYAPGPSGNDPLGWKMVGADISSLELRMLAHYMAPYDEGKYAQLVVNDDVHARNQRAIGLESREQAKTFIYAYLYGAGDNKLGSIVLPLESRNKQAQKGKMLRSRFLQALPALRHLASDVRAVVQQADSRNCLYGLDGRKLYIRSAHSALNSLLQSAGAVLMKLATVFFHWMATQEGWQLGKDYIQVLHVHDEIQLLARPEIAERAGQLFMEAIERAGQHFGLACPMAGEYKVGANWSETH